MLQEESGKAVSQVCVLRLAALGHKHYKAYWLPAQFVQNVWIESYDPTIEDSYRKQIEVDVGLPVFYSRSLKLGNLTNIK